MYRWLRYFFARRVCAVEGCQGGYCGTGARCVYCRVEL